MSISNSATGGIAGCSPERQGAATAWERDLFMAGPMVAVRWCGSTDEHYPVGYVSDNIRRHFGYDREDLVSGRLRWGDILHPDDLAKIEHDLEPYRHSDASRFSHEYRIITRDGRQRWVVDHTEVTRDRDGGVIHCDGYILDITDRKWAEEMRDWLLGTLRTTLARVWTMPGLVRF